MKDLNELARRIHTQNKNWWINIDTGEPLRRDKGELLMLAITELSEAVQGMRKDLMDDHLPHRKMEEVEMADAKIRLLDFAGAFNINVQCGGFVYFFESWENKAGQILKICGSILNADSVNAQAEAMFISHAIDGIEEFCRLHGLDLDGAMEEKLAYNLTRADHSLEQRKLADGKKF